MAFTPANIPLTLWVGNHATIVRGFKSTVDGVDTPIDMSSKAVYFTVFNGETAVLTKSTTAGSVTITGTYSEQVSVTLTPAETRTLAALTVADGDSLMHEIEVRETGVESTWVYGKVKLKGGDNVDA